MEDSLLKGMIGEPAPVAEVRPSDVAAGEWSRRVSRWCTTFVQAFGRPYGTTEEEHARQLLASLPKPTTVTEAWVLRLFLARTAARWMRSLHAMYQADTGTPCKCAIVQCALAVLEGRWSDPAAAFEAWLQTALKQFRRRHPLPLACRIAGLVELQLPDRITAESLARELGTRAPVVRSIVQRRFDQSLHEYLRRARVRRAIELLATTDTKIEVVGMLVGYRSKKNFYCAINRYTGQTPNQVRARMVRRDHAPAGALKESETPRLEHRRALGAPQPRRRSLPTDHPLPEAR